MAQLVSDSPSYNYSNSIHSLSPVQLCDPMNHSTSGLPVQHQLPESSQTYVHWVGDAIQPSNEHPGLISFRMDWLDLLSVQGSLKYLLQYHNLKASVQWKDPWAISSGNRSTFYTVDWLHDKIALIRDLLIAHFYS